jgi:hypothetical protein
VTLANAAWGSQPQMAHIGELRLRARLVNLLMRQIDIKRIRLIDTDLPRNRQYRYAVGALYDWRKDLTLGIAFEYMDAGETPVKQQGDNLRGDLKSEFKNDDVYYLALSMNWKFWKLVPALPAAQCRQVGQMAPTGNNSSLGTRL